MGERIPVGALVTARVGGFRDGVQFPARVTAYDGNRYEVVSESSGARYTLTRARLTDLEGS